MVGKPQTLSKGQAEEVVSIFRKKLLAYGLVFLAIFSGVTGLSLCSIKTQVETIATNRIAKQFEEPHISSLMKQVAEQQSKSILEQQVRPEVTRFKNEVKSKITEFDSYLTELKEKYEHDYTSLSSEIAILKRRNEIMKLGDFATQARDRSALEELKRISRESEDVLLKTAAESEMARLQLFWGTMTSLKGRELSGVGPDGKEKKEDDFTTDELIQKMLSHPQWDVRALAARALQKRKERGVPEALIKCIKNEQNLEVIRVAESSFENVTGYDCPEVFSLELIEKWWVENGEETTAKLKESMTDKTEKRH